MIFHLLIKEKRVLFLCGQEKNEKKPRTSRSIVCAVGSGSVAAIKDGIHAHFVRVIRQPPPFCKHRTGSRSHGARLAPVDANCPVVRTLRAASGGLCELCEHCNTFEPCVYASQQKHESPRQCLGESFGAFLLSEKSTYLLLWKREKRVLFLYAQEKNEKKPRTSRSIVCAAGSGSVAAIKDGIHAHFVRVIRQPPPFCKHRAGVRSHGARLAPAGANFPAAVASRTASGGLCELASTATPSSRGYTIPSRSMRVRDDSLGESFGAFLLSEKSTIFFLWKGETCPFLVRTRKERKEAANVPFDRLCGWRRFDGGYKRRRPLSRGSRDPSTAALLQASCRSALTRRAPCACGRELPSRSCFPHGVFRRGYVLSSRSMRV